MFTIDERAKWYGEWTRQLPEDIDIKWFHIREDGNLDSGPDWRDEDFAWIKLPDGGEIDVGCYDFDYDTRIGILTLCYFPSGGWDHDYFDEHKEDYNTIKEVINRILQIVKVA
jgi:hypothetical protein